MSEGQGLSLPSIISLPTMLCSVFEACSRFQGPQFIDSPVNVSAVAGEDVEFTCRVQHLGRNMMAWVKTDPPNLIAYQRKVFRNRHKYRLEINPSTDAWTLHIRNVQESDAGSYMCQINTNPMKAQKAYLHLRVPPRIDRALTTTDVEVQEGHNVTLHCAAQGTPKPTVYWKRKDKNVIVLGPDGYGVTTHKSANLTIIKVSRSHMTNYECVASNGIPPDESWTIKMHVSFPPSVYPNEGTTSIDGSVGGFARLQCRAEAWPGPEFQWTLNNRSIDTFNDKKYIQNKEGIRGSDYAWISTLIVKQLTDNDFGVYECNAKNRYGKQKATIHLNNVPSNPNIVQSFGSGDDVDGEDDDLDDNEEEYNIEFAPVLVLHEATSNRHHDTEEDSDYNDDLAVVEPEHEQDYLDQPVPVGSTCAPSIQILFHLHFLLFVTCSVLTLHWLQWSS